MNGRKSLICLSVLVLGLFACGDDDHETVPQEVKMEVETGDVLDSTLTSVTLEGTASLQSKSASYEVGIAYCPEDSLGSMTYVKATDVENAYGYGYRSFSVKLTGLQPDAPYTYCAYAKNASGKIVMATEPKTFRTMSPEELLNSSSMQYVAIHDASVCWTISSETVYNELKDKNMNVSLGVAWSTREEELTPTGSQFAANTQELTFNIGQSAFAKLSSLRPSTYYYYVTYVNLNGKLYEGEVNSFVTLDESTVFGQAPEDVKAIDMGLPSGTKWASMNLGASNPTDAGLYYAWGETEGYNADGSDDHLFAWAYYKWCKGTRSSQTKYCTSRAYGTLDNKTVLELADDAAYMNWGGEWRIPTNDEMKELIDNTVNEWTEQDEVEGYKFTSTSTGNSIFFPAKGCRVSESHYEDGTDCYYWLSSVDQPNPYAARYLRFYAGRVFLASMFRYYGMNIRPVRR